uniref:Alanine dehydrogenase/pyridine nucleotide transhydrogenase N-terminal domain-containing protein n=1 Tax=Fagus sylvatica TaxID=28930 RepID=A0A2N9FS88_FAGSY
MEWYIIKVPDPECDSYPFAKGRKRRGGNGWIEVFDPSLQTWESLPNPPFNMLRSRHVMAALLKSKKQISGWTTLVPSVRKIHERALFRHENNLVIPVAIDNTLYWVFFDDDGVACMQAYDLDNNVWFQGRLNTSTIFDFGRHDDVIDDSPPLLLHLHDQKFCILLQSFTDNIEYVNCLILEVSPIFNEFDENENENDDIDDDDRFSKLRISIVSIQKYPMDHRLLVFDFMHVAAVPLSARKRKATGGSAEGIAPFLQLPHFSEAVIKKIACKKVRTFQDLQDMSLQERAELLAQVAGFSPAEVQDVEMVLETMPSIAIEPSTKRIHHDSQYEDVGCQISDDLSECGLILAVKQPKLEIILPDRAYAFFSHTHKAQKENMPLLDKVILTERVSLYDYELIVGEHGKRLLAFGIYAGRAGFIDFLRGLGQRYLSLGYSTPFLSLGASYMYPSLAAAKAAVISVGEEIATQGLPSGICPAGLCIHWFRKWYN